LIFKKRLHLAVLYEQDSLPNSLTWHLASSPMACFLRPFKNSKQGLL